MFTIEAPQLQHRVEATQLHDRCRSSLRHSKVSRREEKSARRQKKRYRLPLAVVRCLHVFGLWSASSIKAYKAVVFVPPELFFFYFSSESFGRSEIRRRLSNLAGASGWSRPAANVATNRQRGAYCRALQQRTVGEIVGVPDQNFLTVPLHWLGDLGILFCLHRRIASWHSCFTLLSFLFPARHCAHVASGPEHSCLNRAHRMLTRTGFWLPVQQNVLRPRRHAILE